MIAGYRRLSASCLDVARVCPASCALPAVDVGSSPEQRAGTRRHEVLDRFAALWTECGDPDRAAAAALAAFASVEEVEGDDEDDEDEKSDVAPWLETMRRVDLPHQLTSRGRVATRVETGLGFAVHVETLDVRELGHVEARAYTLDEGWVCGTFDWLLTFADGGPPVLVDFKGSLRCEPARDNMQVAFYAAAVAAVRGYREIDVEIRYIEDDGEVVVDAARLDDWALDGGLTRVQEVARAVDAARAAVAAGAPPPMRAGTHCRRCPSLRVCPAQIASLAAFVDEERRDAIRVLGLSPEEAGAAWVRLDAIGEFLKRVKAALRERAITDGGLPLGGGERLRPIRSTRKNLNLEKALPVLREEVGDRVDSLLTQTLKTTAVDRLGVEVARDRGGKVKDGKARLWARLHEAGAVTSSAFTQLRVVKDR